jgi:hypothetical protein
VDVPCYVTLVQARDSASDTEKFIWETCITFRIEDVRSQTGIKNEMNDIKGYWTKWITHFEKVGQVHKADFEI